MVHAPAHAPGLTSAIHVDLADFIERQPVGAFQVRLLLVCAAVLFIDGFDTQAIGYVAPSIGKEWGLERGALGPVFSAGLFGLMLGALIIGPISDRIGRRRVIIASVAAFGVATLATMFARDVTELLVLRFITGIGLGGAMPNAVALTAEVNPHRRRATMVMFMFAGFSLGAAVGGLIAAALIPHFGWSSVFLVGGLAPLLLVPLLLARLPESVRFLALSGDNDARIGALLEKIAPAVRFAPGTVFTVAEEKLEGLPVKRLFADGRTPATLAFWVLFFMSLLDLYLLSNWLPTVVNDLGASVSVAAIIGSMLQVGGFAGVFTLGRFIDRFSYRALAVTYLVAALAVGTIGLVGHSTVLLTAAIFASGFCIVGGQIASNALAATFYPTNVRSTGIGWALGIGRLGSIVGPLVGGALIARHVGLDKLFLFAAVPAVIACVAAVFLSRLDGRS